MARRKKAEDGGAPSWLLTFADLMSLLVCFFVLIISFSVQDQQKLQVVAGSIRDAFGIKQESKRTGIIELDGVPLRDYMKDASLLEELRDADFATVSHMQRRKQGPEANTHSVEETDVEKPRQFATAAVSLRQAFQEMPEITELSSNIIMEETEEGLNILIVDQEGRSMFPEGSKYPYEITRRLLAKMAPVLSQMPNRIRVTGHTTSGYTARSNAASLWDLSTGRANAAQHILTESGLPSDRIHSVVGKADTEPLFPNDPFLAANRRISVLLMAEEPPLPQDYQP
ncbi:flagellar motor protein MotB [Pseudovibrio exalbescens]|uniref:OmpA/MotB family protein n=1 Tax=Pseudovibrio exalbescens TaxID=197461 RepID=UPI002365A4EB|nr:flagellar motor protein MotB [Pseudovibrio exalbescens]MDD7911834.1 flagellar motor protein MotB [Pseudovibrio exalbescens]